MDIDWLLLLSVGIAVVGNTTCGVGYIIQKTAHNRIKAKPVEEQKSFATNRLWLLGFGVYATGSICNAAALAYGPQSILTPLQSLALVANALLAPHFLGEKLQRKDIFATLLIIGGAVLSVIFGPHGNSKEDINTLIAKFVETGFVLFGICVGGMAVVDWLSVRITERRNKAAGIVLTGSLDQPTAKFLALSYTFLASVYSCFTLLFTKITATIVQQSIVGDNQFIYGLTYLMLFLFVFCNIGVERWKQRALGIFDALYVVPVLEVAIVVLTIVGSGIYFHEFNELTTLEAGLFVLGVLIICAGIFVLSQTEAEETWQAETKKLFEDEGLEPLPLLGKEGDGKRDSLNPVDVKPVLPEDEASNYHAVQDQEETPEGFSVAVPINGALSQQQPASLTPTNGVNGANANPNSPAAGALAFPVALDRSRTPGSKDKRISSGAVVVMSPGSKDKRVSSSGVLSPTAGERITLATGGGIGGGAAIAAPTPLRSSSSKNKIQFIAISEGMEEHDSAVSDRPHTTTTPPPSMGDAMSPAIKLRNNSSSSSGANTPAPRAVTPGTEYRHSSSSSSSSSAVATGLAVNPQSPNATAAGAASGGANPEFGRQPSTPEEKALRSPGPAGTETRPDGKRSTLENPVNPSGALSMNGKSSLVPPVDKSKAPTPDPHNYNSVLGSLLEVVKRSAIVDTIARSALVTSLSNLIESPREGVRTLFRRTGPTDHRSSVAVADLDERTPSQPRSVATTSRLGFSTLPARMKHSKVKDDKASLTGRHAVKPSLIDIIWSNNSSTATSVTSSSSSSSSSDHKTTIDAKDDNLTRELHLDASDSLRTGMRHSDPSGSRSLPRSHSYGGTGTPRLGPINSNAADSISISVGASNMSGALLTGQEASASLSAAPRGVRTSSTIAEESPHSTTVEPTTPGLNPPTPPSPSTPEHGDVPGALLESVRVQQTGSSSSVDSDSR